jgi:hypothetical protein
MPQAHFEIFLDVDKKHRFRLRAPNGEIIATSEAYESKQACKDTIRIIRKYAATSEVQDLTLKTA